MTARVTGRRLAAAATLAAIFACTAVPAAAGEARPLCKDNSRRCLLATAMTYLDGLSRHDSSAIAFTPNVRATEQNKVVVTNADKFRAEIDGSTAITGARNIRLMADPATGSVAAFYVLDIAGEGGKPAYSVWRGQRFRIVAGRVSEVEVYNYIEPQPAAIGAALWPGGVRLPHHQ